MSKPMRRFHPIGPALTLNIAVQIRRIKLRPHLLPWSAFAWMAAILSMFMSPLAAQQASQQPQDGIAIRGTVRDSTGIAVDAAVVRLQWTDAPGMLETKTDEHGLYAFNSLRLGSYVLSAQKADLRSHPVYGTAALPPARIETDLVLLASGKPPGQGNSTQPGAHDGSATASAMEFSDSPTFSIAGVTDWTAAGGHGSDASLRTSEALTRETLTLKPGDPGSNQLGHTSAPDASEVQLREALNNAPGSFEANRRLGEFYLRAGKYSDAIPCLDKSYNIDPASYDIEFDLALALKGSGDRSRAREHIEKLLARRETADLRRVSAELYEMANDPLGAVREFERAVVLDPTETNYFEWGSELLLHRAVWQAQEVFQRGTNAYPRSARLLAALGAALFAGARYDEAALRLCDASDLNPADTEPYLFMGKIEIAAPTPLPCVEQKLARFAQLHPDSSLANYFYAMALWKEHAQKPDSTSSTQVEALLAKAVAIDPKCADAFLQLGVLYASQQDFAKAIGFYTKAIEANPELAEAHYRMGVAYDRTGQSDLAKQEFQLHDSLRKKQAATVDAQRREVKQFLVVEPGQTPVAK